MSLNQYLKSRNLQSDCNGAIIVPINNDTHHILDDIVNITNERIIVGSGVIEGFFNVFLIQ